MGHFEHRYSDGYNEALSRVSRMKQGLAKREKLQEVREVGWDNVDWEDG
jgi:hypothetical protein